MRSCIPLLPLLLLWGCAGQGYLAHRANDGADCLSLTVGAGVGAKASLGPLYVNSFGVCNRDLAGFRYGDFLASPANSEDSDVGSWLGGGSPTTPARTCRSAATRPRSTHSPTSRS